MPIYSFRCLKCDNKYEDLVPHDPTGKYKKIKCPVCKSKRKERYLQGEDKCITFDKPKESSKYKDNFSYRAGVNMENAKEDRRKAEKLSHMGTSPYPNIN